MTDNPHAQELDLLKASAGGDMQAVIDAARASAEPAEILRVSPVVVHRDMQVIEPDETHDERPRRKRGTARLLDPKSFADYVNRHAVDSAEADDGAEVWADVERQALVAVLNPHTPNNDFAGWGDHRAEYAVRKTVAWLAWEALNGKLHRQDMLAELFEDRLPDFVAPDGAHMLELVQSFQATVGVRFESAKRLDNGERQLTYKEDVQASAGRAGSFEIPATFDLALRPFEGAEGYKVTCRFRYRITDGTLFVGYSMVNPEELLASAFRDVVGEVEGMLDDAHFTYRGTAPAPQTPLRSASQPF